MPPLAALAALTAVALTACDRGGRDVDPGASGDLEVAPATASPRRATHDLAATPEATSLLGEPLFPLLPDSAERVRMLAQLDSAEAAYEADPQDPDALVWLGRRLAYLGRYRGAIDVFTEGIERHPDEPRLHRHRGHRFITVRELDRAIEDLEHAARLVSGQEDVVEPDGQPNAAGIPRSTLHTNIWYHLGLARYVTGDMAGAAHAFGHGLEISPNDDMRVAMADWLWLSYVRLGRAGDAAGVLEQVLADSMEIMENQAYHRRLRLYAGELSPDSLLPRDADPLAVATYGYGLGTWHLVRGDTTAALAVYEDLLATGYWPAFGFLAAEAELARLRDAGGGTGR
ncbi:MAG TPA: tetratricopeptide repeat protein [Longimicrobiales bacterium]|nr:tetratricopeptide repeat protein [Longimicrobiales bacterium]